MGKGEGAKNKTSRQATTGTADVKIGTAKMLKGGVIMDVVDAEQARIVSNQCRPQTTRALRKTRFQSLGGRRSRRRRARAESEGAKDAPRLIEPSERSTQTQSRAQAEGAAGAVAVMAPSASPSPTSARTASARMSDPQMIEGIKKAVTIPVMAKRASATSSRPRCWKRPRSTTSTSLKC